MRVDVSKFGTVLLSRPDGREAFLVARAYHIPKGSNDSIELDFSGVTVLTPGWADEFTRGLEDEFGKERIRIIEGANLTVRDSFKTIRELRDHSTSLPPPPRSDPPVAEKADPPLADRMTG